MPFSRAGNETARRLTGTAFLSGFVLCSAAAAGLLFANRDHLVRQADWNKPDAAVDAYLRAQESLHPSDMNLKYKIARRDVRMGRYSEARQQIEKLTNSASPVRNEALRLELELELQKVFSKADPAQQQAAVRALVPRIEQYYKTGAFRDVKGKTSFVALERAAQLSEWGLRPQLALQMWEQLSREGRSEKACANVIRLAKYLADYPAVCRGLEYMSQLRPLTAAELGDIYFAKSTMGEAYSEEMLAYFRTYLERYPKEAAVWDMYQFLLESSGDLARTQQAVLAREKALGATVVSRNKIAELNWRLGDEAAAFDALEDLRPDPPSSEKQYWLNYAELAWRLRKDAQAYKAAELLFREKVGGELMPERLALLRREAGDYKASSLIAMRAWLAYQKPRFLILALDAAISSGDKQLVRQTYEVAHATETIFVHSDNYWVLKASAIMAEAPKEEVFCCFQKALSINPDSPRARRALVWYLVETGWKQKLATVLPMWAAYAETDSELWYPYAIGYENLGQLRQSLKWYKLVEQHRSTDADFLVRYANALINSGYTWRGRRMIARAEALIRII